MKKLIFLFAVFYYSIFCYAYKVPKDVVKIKDNNKLHYELNRANYKIAISEIDQGPIPDLPHFFIIIRTITKVTKEDLEHSRGFFDIIINNKETDSFGIFWLSLDENERFSKYYYKLNVSDKQLKEISEKKINAVFISSNNFSDVYELYESIEYLENMKPSSIQIKYNYHFGNFVNGEIEKDASKFINDLFIMVKFYQQVCSKKY